MQRIRDHIEYVFRMLYMDWDGVYLICGDEGISKSTLGLHILDMFYTLQNGVCRAGDIKHICLDAREYLEDLRDLKKFECTIYDEAGDIMKRRTMSAFNVMLMKTYQIIRGDNLLTVLILPSVFDLDPFFSTRRVKGLYYVYRRGRVAYYSSKRLRGLVELNRPLLVKNMGLVKPTFVDTFPKYKGVLARGYEKKKVDKMSSARQQLYDDYINHVEVQEKVLYDELTCVQCGYTWSPKVKSPRKCPNCNSKKYNDLGIATATSGS